MVARRTCSSQLGFTNLGIRLLLFPDPGSPVSVSLQCRFQDGLWLPQVLAGAVSQDSPPFGAH